MAITSKEALETVKDYLLQKLKEDNSELGSIIIVESVNVLEKLVERDTPKKVCYDKVGRSECPSCDRNYLYNGRMNINKYCGYCGQRLDWSRK